MNINEVFKELAEYKRIKEEAESMIEGLQDEIKKYMTDESLDTLTGDEHKATYKAVTSTRIDTTALKKAEPAIAAMFTKSSSAMRFTFS